jgi:hypothetical protein
MQTHRHGSTNARRHGDGLTLDGEISTLAARQHGVVGRAQLLDAGVSPKAIEHRLARKRLHRVYARVYSVGHPLLPPWGRFMAAVLACGPGAVLSHRDGAALLGLLPLGSGLIEVTTPHRGARGRRGIALKRTRRLPAEETTTCERIPCTTFARTLIDLAGCETERRLRRALEQSLVLRMFDLRAMNAALASARGRAGIGALRRLLAEAADEPPFTRSELERRFLELVRKANLPLPVVNGLVHCREVDFHWPQHRLIVETDSRTFHAHALAFRQDRQRDLDLELGGWHVLRITWRQVLEEPERVAALVRSRLTRARA